ncbi:hypothetical protein E3P89_02395 [Wallemia ichthyophaga]|nr:uncharacterized protein J056_004400 [Wallemia ichthyophaga EXF-994]TIA90108.1 hypothetical protein E3P97_02714 [Wallemia ichthyophaga]EOR01079.1 hypothetical protein J056_004400 [Wallemia ichthyophaga EXF-994]TIA94741.1 hypothetical protein E3P96_04038 [Wallemia ichthyophaga]TIA99889.1 hypothetical protein E3P94_02417 [Wallemia ichthyophaga]TIB21893.1 hypothetical protein E3P89_02395 [Wallemia ichthyophaga]
MLRSLQHIRRSSRLGLQLRSYASTPDRSTHFAKLTQDDIPSLASIFSSPHTSLLTTLGDNPTATKDDLEPFNVDWMGKYRGHSSIIAKPKTTEEVSKLLQWCNQHNVAVVPQGGNTGLVGGSVPLHDEVVLSLSSMNSVRHFDSLSGYVSVDSGIVLENLDNFLAQKGHVVPLDLGAKGSCQIGGNVATNAGGLRMLRYGSLHGNVLGLEVVLPDGRIINGMKGLKKDNTGIDLKQLFIGSEGVLGVVTGVTLATPVRPSATNVAVFALPDYESVQTAFSSARRDLGEILSAFEFFDAASYKLVRTHGHAAERKTFEDGEDAPFFCLVETSGSNKDHDDEKLGAFLEQLMESGIVNDGVLAQDETQIAQLWTLREGIPEAAGKAGRVYKYDLSLPVEKMYSLVPELRQKLAEQGLLAAESEGGNGNGPVKTVFGFGHLGDGNLHINIVADAYRSEVEKVVEPYIYELVANYNGSISAEHGLGLMKAPYVSYSQDAPSLDLMRTLKKTLDPKGILNPYKCVTVE